VDSDGPIAAGPVVVGAFAEAEGLDTVVRTRLPMMTLSAKAARQGRCVVDPGTQ
jgi:hypothetical protein